MDKHAIIKLKQKGYSNRKVGEMLGMNRKTVGKYWNEYVGHTQLLTNNPIAIKEIQEKICEAPVYDASNRKARKYSPAMDEALDKILESESEKCKELGVHKQQLTNEQIHQLMLKQEFNISYSTISNYVRIKRDKIKECFIKQSYDYGDRLEYDFGEVKLLINGVLGTYHLAVLSSPAANFRWAYLYKNQKQEVFIDSQVRFFEMVGGIYKEIVYDNMKNVVTKFIGKNEKEINEELLKLSLYYGFDINVTNCYRGNEKGHVEGSVKVIRNKVFALTYKFKTFEEACDYLQHQLIDLNENSTISEEIKHLGAHKPSLDLAKVTHQKVNKYSFVRIQNNHYSVPEHLVDKTITVKTYHDKLMIYANNILVCEHKKIDGQNEISIDIRHYLKSLNKKPGALRNSLALKSIPQLKTIYENYFTTNPRRFIELIQKNNEKSINGLVQILGKYTSSPKDILDNYAIDNHLLNSLAQEQVVRYNELCLKEVK